MRTKVCSECNVEKLIEQFYKQKDSSLGVSSKCKLCISNQKHNYYLLNKIKILANKHEYYLENKENILLRQKEKHLQNP